MSGTETHVMSLRASDSAGVMWVGPAAASPDGQWVVFSYYRQFSSLFTVSIADAR